MRFYLGTPIPGWLDDPRFEGVPLFVSRNRLLGHVAETRARTCWALDSGAFTQIARHGRWTVDPRQYAREAARWRREIGRMVFAASMDWMVEPEMLARTGKSVVEHQVLTTRSFLELRDLDPTVPWIPILQGQATEDYLRHVDRFDRAGVDLRKEPLVGVGSVCRRESTDEAEELMQVLYRLGLTTHFFGVKTTGLRRGGRYLESADSMAWSYAARFRPVRLPGCPHATCENCPTWALLWRRRLLRALGDSI